MMRPSGGVILRACARAPATWGAAWAGMLSSWAAASRSSTRAARGLLMGAKMMWSCGRGGEPSGEESKSGRRMRAISVRLLSRRQLKSRVRGRDFGELGDGGAEGPGAGGVVGYVEQDLRGGVGRISRRPGQRVLRIPASMLAFVIL